MESFFETRSLKLIGIDIATPKQVEGMTRGWAAACAADSIPYPVQAAARPVFADADGKQFVLEAASNGLFGRPWETSPVWNPKDPNVRGGLLGIGDLPTRSPGPGVAMAEFSAVYQAANEEVVKQGGPGLGEKVLEQAKAMGVGLATNLAGMAMQGLMGGGLAGKIDGLLSQQGMAGLATGALGQIVGAVTSQLFNSVWGVDDESSTLEHVAHQYAEQGLQELQGQFLESALQGNFSPDIIGNLKAKVAKFLGIAAVPQFAAIRFGDLDKLANPVLGPCSSNVMIEGQPAAREGDVVGKAGVKLFLGSATVNTNGLIATRIADTVSQVAPFPKGAAKTFIGGGTGGAPPPSIPEAPGSAAPGAPAKPGGAAAGGEGGEGGAGEDAPPDEGETPPDDETVPPEEEGKTPDDKTTEPPAEEGKKPDDQTGEPPAEEGKKPENGTTEPPSEGGKKPGDDSTPGEGEPHSGGEKDGSSQPGHEPDGSGEHTGGEHGDGEHGEHSSMHGALEKGAEEASNIASERIEHNEQHSREHDVKKLDEQISNKQSEANANKANLDAAKENLTAKQNAIAEAAKEQQASANRAQSPAEFNEAMSKAAENERLAPQRAAELKAAEAKVSAASGALGKSQGELGALEQAKASRLSTTAAEYGGKVLHVASKGLMVLDAINVGPKVADQMVNGDIKGGLVTYADAVTRFGVATQTAEMAAAACLPVAAWAGLPSAGVGTLAVEAVCGFAGGVAGYLGYEALKNAGSYSGVSDGTGGYVPYMDPKTVPESYLMKPGQSNNPPVGGFLVNPVTGQVRYG